MQAHLKHCVATEGQQQRTALHRQSKVLTRQPSPQDMNESLQSSAKLVARGHLLLASSTDRARLQAEVARTIPQAQLINAFQVPRAAQHGIYEALKENIGEHRAGELPEERELWHGTSWDTIPKILTQGFNRIFAGRHGTLLGVATYFSTDLAYSQRFCDRRGGGKDGTKVAILARVLVGRYSKGASTDVEPPLFDTEAGLRYDSTVDDKDNPKIFAIFRDFQACPLFLVEFRS